MNGIYRFSSEGIRKYKRKQLNRLSVFFFILSSPLIFGPLFFEKFKYDIGYFLACIFVLLIWVSIYLFVGNIFTNTIIEIQDEKIIRKGKRLCDSTLKYSEIGKIVTRKDGVILSHKNKKYWSKTALIDDTDCVFIPYGIGDFELLVKHIESKIENT